MNFHDSERIAGILSAEGYTLTDKPENADLIFFNTCSIREKAEQKFYSDLGRMRRLKKMKPYLKIGVGGCIAQQEGEGIFERFPYVNLIIGTQNIESLAEVIRAERKISLEERPDYVSAKIPSLRADSVKAWVSIMYGCNNFCSYCVVPYTRGRERSRAWIDIYREVESLAHDGYKEVTLLGQNVNSYGRDLEGGIDFSDLLQKLHKIKGIERIRFVTSHPKDLSLKLTRAMKDLPMVCEHIHLPLQSGSDRILRLMNRKYTYEDYKDKVNVLRREIPEIAITTDIITGFPGETEDDFEKTLMAIDEVRYDGIFAFKYSRRPSTSAFNLPDNLSEEERSERLKRVLEIQDTVTLEKNRELVGKEFEILVEGKSKTDKDKMTGRTRTNKIVNFNGRKDQIGDSTLRAGEMIKIRITEAKLHSLSGECLCG